MLFPCMFTIQRDDFQVSEKKDISWAVKLAGSWERITYISKGQRKNLQFQVSKVNALRKEIRDNSQEETCPKGSPGKGEC